VSRFLEQLAARLEHPALPPPPRRWAVAFSGGLDSTVLLHGLVQLEGAERVRAIHVNHGLQPESEQWAATCQARAAGLGVSVTVLSVQVAASGSASLEAAARAARYRALAEELGPGEILITAHHADDQLETMLLALMRGAGLRGLQGALAASPFAAGTLFRPLLAEPRSDLRRWAEEQGLDWLEDPSNEDTRFDRNYLRQTVLPALHARWGNAGPVASRAAEHLHDGVLLTEQLAREDAARLDDAQRPRADQLRALDAPRLRNLLRLMIRRAGLPVPDRSRLKLLEDAVGAASPRSRSAVQWPGGEGRFYRGRLYLGAPMPASMPAAPQCLLTDECPWTGWSGRVSLYVAGAVGLPGTWIRHGLTVRYRRGGELLPAPVGHRPGTLKRLLAAARVVPWMRPYVPVLYFDGSLVAVADLWISSAALAAEPGEEPRYQVRWACPRLVC
jgi:tRNA(Ile)-lysidine synthase